jgi:hypothetical protein
LEALINGWLEEFEPDVTQMSQTVEGSGCVTLSFLYDESFRGQERRLDNEHGMSQVPNSVAAEPRMPDDPVHVTMTPPERGPEPDTGA